MSRLGETSDGSGGDPARPVDGLGDRACCCKERSVGRLSIAGNIQTGQKSREVLPCFFKRALDILRLDSDD